MVIKHLAVPFLYTPFHKLQDGTATEINLLTKGNKRGKMRQIISKKSYVVYTLLILFSFTTIPTADISALSYQTDVGVSFTFNPTLSVSISPSDLTISNLTPGTTDASNEISINVSTNNVYGYNLYATVGNSNYSNTNLTHSSGNDTFTSISTTADLSNLTTDNTWGYTYSLDNDTTWSNYNGLPLYTTDNPTRLKKNTGPSEDTVNFKIAAKSSTTQPSGTYTNVINFMAVTKPTPVTLADAYASEGKELYHGYYKMQDMTPTICEETEDIGAQLQVIDIRDDKVYWISKLADNNCWMTQNLDLDIDDTKIYTHYDTDLGWTTLNENATWQVTEGHSTIKFMEDIIENWVDSNVEPYSANKTDDPGSGHSSLGNYYNWSAAVANNNTADFAKGNAENSVCPSGWRLPNNSTNDFKNLADSYQITGSNALDLLNSPLYFIRSGNIHDALLNLYGNRGTYWTSTARSGAISYYLNFYNGSISTGGYNHYNNGRSYAFTVRCLAR